MSNQHNPYTTPQSLRAPASLEEYADPMEEGSQEQSKASPNSSEKRSEQLTPNSMNKGNQEVKVEEEEELLPPSFHRTTTEETL